MGNKLERKLKRRSEQLTRQTNWRSLLLLVAKRTAPPLWLQEQRQEKKPLKIECEIYDDVP